MSTFSENLKQLRKDEKITIIELSSKIGYSKSIISYWENGVKEPTLSALEKLSKYFCVSIDYLLGNEAHYGNHSLNLSMEEEELIKNFRAMRPDLQIVYLGMSETFIQKPETLTGKSQNKKL